MSTKSMPEEGATVAAQTAVPPALEAADPDCLSPEEADALLRDAPWSRFAIIGDSIAEGVMEPLEGYAPERWGDRVAAALGRRRPDLAYLNLGKRGLLAAEVRATQLEAALAFEPDLASVICGGNDLLVEHFDPAAVEQEVEAMVAPLAEAGADIVTFTLLDITRALEMPPEFGDQLRERLHGLFEVWRRIAARHRTVHVEMATHPAAADPGIYSSDFQHANSRGHAIVAAATIRRLGEHLANAPPVGA